MARASRTRLASSKLRTRLQLFGMGLDAYFCGVTARIPPYCKEKPLSYWRTAAESTSTRTAHNRAASSGVEPETPFRYAERESLLDASGRTASIENSGYW